MNQAFVRQMHESCTLPRVKLVSCPEYGVGHVATTTHTLFAFFEVSDAIESSAAVVVFLLSLKPTHLFQYTSLPSFFFETLLFISLAAPVQSVLLWPHRTGFHFVVCFSKQVS